MDTVSKPACPIVLVDDEDAILRSYRITLHLAGYNNTVLFNDSRSVLPWLAENEAELIVLDLSMPYIDGQQILEAVAKDYPELPVIIVTGLNEVITAVECMKNGATDFMVKPVEPAFFLSGVKQAIETRSLQRENLALRDALLSGELRNRGAFDSIITRNRSMHSIFQYVEKIAVTANAVLITGESGVGKELIAKCLHNLSGRRGNFVAVNIAGLDDTMFSDTLFGHEAGAYTGATSKRAGLIEKASGGTLFLDEIGDLGLGSQVRLLRLLQEGEYYPLGSDEPRITDVRIVTATNHNLQQAQREGEFRKDLFYRLGTHRIQIPPLRERLEDIPLLVDYFLNEAADAIGKNKPNIPDELYTLLKIYQYPGNIRELQGMVVDSMTQHDRGTLSTQVFREYIAANRGDDLLENAQDLADSAVPIHIATDPSVPFPTLREATKLIIDEALNRVDGNQTVAAQLLGISRQTLIRRIKHSSE